MKKSLIFLISILFLSLYSGCTAHQVEPKISMKAPLYVEQSSRVESTKRCNSKYEGSIYGSRDGGLFSDKKAMAINDIVTVVIDENTFQSSQGKKNITDTSFHDIGGGIFRGSNRGGVSSEIANGLNALTDIGFKTNSNSNFNGAGTQSRKEKFSTVISARVVKILDNGNYFIDGSRSLLLNGTKQIIRITGTIRAYDIDQLNTINSKYIADAKIHYETEGDIKEATRRPWGSRVVDSVWPF